MALLATKGKAPGVYIQEITIPGPIAGAATSIAAFVGPAATGPLFEPMELTNITQFNTLFGGYIEDPYRVFVTHAVNGFFAEGGTDCWFVRVGKGQQAKLDLQDRSGKTRVALVVKTLKEGVAGNSITATVANANIASAKAARATATIAAGGAPVNQRTVKTASAADAANFRPGDTVLLTKGANNERASIANISKDTVANTTTFTMVVNITNDYGAGTIRIADLIAGQTKVRVDNAAGIEPGSYVVITQGARNEAAVVVTVDQINSTIKLTKGLANTYTMAGPDPDVTVVTQEFTLTITAPGNPVEAFPNLSVDPRHSRYFGRIVSSASVSVSLADPPTVTLPAGNLPVALAATNLASGTDENLNALVPADYQKGIDLLQKISEVRILCVPDCVTTQPSASSHFQPADTQAIQAAMISHCEKMQDRFAILDSSAFDRTDTTFSAIQQQRQNLNSDGGYAALYFPWIGISNPAGSGQILVPPSGHTAGIFANNDTFFGVFKAPANEQIRTALSVEVRLADDEQGPLNDLGINVIRTFPFQGVKIWGARTIAPPDVTAWRFVNVRRLLLFIEKSIQDGTRFAVFEPNNLALWQRVKRMVTDFLMDEWKGGALFGNTPDKAFRVRVDETLNPPEIRAQGILVVEVTVVPTTPAEFIIFQVVQDITGSTLREA